MRDVRKPRTTIDHEARRTSEKIDAIESELSAEFGNARWLPSVSAIESGEDLPPLAQCLDEAALLFTNQQIEAARDLLLHTCAIQDDDDERRQAWWMLFELALEQNQPEFFDKLALDYASTFETSPPQWKLATESTSISESTLPVINFRGKLSGNSLPALRQLQQTGTRHGQFCLEFGAIAEIDLDGCAMLLQVFLYWQLQHCKISIGCGDLLATALRPLIQTGRRDKNDAGWRLLIELMRLMNRHEEHEALCADYCITYEVSPPSAPIVAATPVKSLAPSGAARSFLLPARIMLPVDDLLLQIADHAATSDLVLLDCARLMRVDLSAAAPWLNGLRRVASGKPVECRDIGFLVARLLKLVGDNSQLNIIHRKP